MHSVVHAIDKPGAFQRRMERIDAPDPRAGERAFADDLLATSDIWGRLTISRIRIRQNTVGARAGPQA